MFRHIFDRARKVFGIDRLCHAGCGTVYSRNRCSVRFFERGEDNDACTIGASTDRLEYGHAMRAGIEINNDQREIANVLVQKLKCFAARPDASHSVVQTSGCLRHRVFAVSVRINQ